MTDTEIYTQTKCLQIDQMNVNQWISSLSFKIVLFMDANRIFLVT